MNVRFATVILAGGLLFALGAWLYWPGISGPDLLDDRSSVMVGGDLGANPDEVLDFILGDTSGLLGRYVSMSTFALEKLYLDGGMAGSKKVNIVLHLVNAALFMLLAGLLFRHERIRGYRWLALLLGSVWLLHPLQVSSVLYVVQRMAMLSTFFMLLTLLAYVRWRLNVIAGQGNARAFAWVPVLLVVGMFAKENAIVVVPVLVMLEVLWFRFKGEGGTELRWLRKLSYGLIVVGAAALTLFYVWYHEALVSSYRGRQFTLEERMLTQGRILWDYVGQWFWPQVSRMGLYHDDFPLSRSLTDPVTTAYALLAWVAVGVASVVLLRWRDGALIVFGVCWFLLGHAVESTVIPLELYFEHRNYFPAMGLMLMVGGVYGAVVRRWPEPAAPLLLILGFTSIVCAGLASSQVQVWSHRQLLTLHHLNGHPGSFRANVDMAAEMAELGQIEAARRYSLRAHEAASAPAAQGERWGDYQVRDIALACIAGAEVSQQQLAELGTVHPSRPFSSVNTVLTLVRMIQAGECTSVDTLQFADRMAEIFLVDDFRHVGSMKIFSALAVLENALRRYDKAYAYMERYLAFSPRDPQGLLMKLHFAVALGKTAEADALVAQLVQMDAQGLLTVGQGKTLALYRDE